MNNLDVLYGELRALKGSGSMTRSKVYKMLSKALQSHLSEDEFEAKVLPYVLDMVKGVDDPTLFIAGDNYHSELLDRVGIGNVMVRGFEGVNTTGHVRHVFQGIDSHALDRRERFFRQDYEYRMRLPYTFWAEANKLDHFDGPGAQPIKMSEGGRVRVLHVNDFDLRVTVEASTCDRVRYIHANSLALSCADFSPLPGLKFLSVDGSFDVEVVGPKHTWESSGYPGNNWQPRMVPFYPVTMDIEVLEIPTPDDFLRLLRRGIRFPDLKFICFTRTDHIWESAFNESMAVVTKSTKAKPILRKYDTGRRSWDEDLEEYGNAVVKILEMDDVDLDQLLTTADMIVPHYLTYLR